jgi:hypothetical protein
MGSWRLFRRKNVLPGVRVNLPKSGPSLSFGVRGAHVTLGRRGVTRTVGIPGTGIFYTSRSGRHTGAHTTRRPSRCHHDVFAERRAAIIGHRSGTRLEVADVRGTRRCLTFAAAPEGDGLQVAVFCELRFHLGAFADAADHFGTPAMPGIETRAC